MTDADLRTELEHYHASYSEALDDLQRYRELYDELRRVRGVVGTRTELRWERDPDRLIVIVTASTSDPAAFERRMLRAVERAIRAERLAEVMDRAVADDEIDEDPEP